MGAMMFFMMRGKDGQSKSKDYRPSLAELKAEQARLAAQIDRLESVATDEHEQPAREDLATEAGIRE